MTTIPIKFFSYIEAIPKRCRKSRLFFAENIREFNLKNISLKQVLGTKQNYHLLGKFDKNHIFFTDINGEFYKPVMMSDEFYSLQMRCIRGFNLDEININRIKKFNEEIYCEIINDDTEKVWSDIIDYFDDKFYFKGMLVTKTMEPCFEVVKYGEGENDLMVCLLNEFDTTSILYSDINKRTEYLSSGKLKEKYGHVKKIFEQYYFSVFDDNSFENKDYTDIVTEIKKNARQLKFDDRLKINQICKNARHNNLNLDNYFDEILTKIMELKNGCDSGFKI